MFEILDTKGQNKLEKLFLNNNQLTKIKGLDKISKINLNNDGSISWHIVYWYE
jgi:hypothetical protein